MAALMQKVFVGKKKKCIRKKLNPSSSRSEFMSSVHLHHDLFYWQFTIQIRVDDTIFFLFKPSRNLLSFSEFKVVCQARRNIQGKYPNFTLYSVVIA